MLDLLSLIYDFFYALIIFCSSSHEKILEEFTIEENL